MIPVPSLPFSSGPPELYKVHRVLFANPTHLLSARTDQSAPACPHFTGQPENPAMITSASHVLLQVDHHSHRVGHEEEQGPGELLAGLLLPGLGRPALPPTPSYRRAPQSAFESFSSKGGPSPGNSSPEGRSLLVASVQRG